MKNDDAAKVGAGDSSDTNLRLGESQMNIEDLALQVVKDVQGLSERAEGRYIQNTPEVERAIALWQAIKKQFPNVEICGYYCAEGTGHVDHA